MINSYNILDLGKSDYKKAWELQKKLQSQRISGEIDDQLLLVEHFPVYTLGKNAPTEHLLINDYDDISIVQSDRGGNVTFHGPGQLVGYPILDLNNYRKSITWYMRELEETLIEVLAHLGLQGRRIPGMTGLWLEDRKIASIGVGCRRWITQHGLALNVACDLSGFDEIVPCGLVGKPVGSLNNWLPGLSVFDVQPLMCRCLSNRFGLGWFSS